LHGFSEKQSEDASRTSLWVRVGEASRFAWYSEKQSEDASRT